MNTISTLAETPNMDTRTWRQHRDALLTRVALPDIMGHVPRCPHPQHPTNLDHHRIELYQPAQIPRWACLKCGAGGTAIDWISHASDLSPIDAFEQLHNLPQDNTAQVRTFPTERECIKNYVDDCVNTLWTDLGAPGRHWLQHHGLLSEDTLRTNQIGFDTGPHRIARSQGLPSNGPAIVIPIASRPNLPIESVRVLSIHRNPHRRKPQHRHWITPSWNIVGKRTQLGFFPTANDNNKEILVVNNLIDALTAVTLHHPAVAVLSHGEMQTSTLNAIRALSQVHQLRICYPTKTTDQLAAATLQSLLRDLEINVLTLPSDASDLNQWHQLRLAQ